MALEKLVTTLRSRGYVFSHAKGEVCVLVDTGYTDQDDPRGGELVELAQTHRLRLLTSGDAWPDGRITYHFSET
jgi:hypothetical protein